MTATLLFFSTYFLVLLLGLQSLIVNSSLVKAAFVNSFLIGLCNLALFKIAPDATGIEIVAYLSGGPFGIVSSIHLFRWYRSIPEGFSVTRYARMQLINAFRRLNTIPCSCGCKEVFARNFEYLPVLDNGTGPVLEFEEACTNCGLTVNYWATGYYQYPETYTEEFSRWLYGMRQSISYKFKRVFK